MEETNTADTTASTNEQLAKLIKENSELKGQLGERNRRIKELKTITGEDDGADDANELKDTVDSMALKLADIEKTNLELINALSNKASSPVATGGSDQEPAKVETWTQEQKDYFAKHNIDPDVVAKNATV